MWTKPLQTGGVVGGDDLNIPGDTFFEGSAYINRFSNPIILAGKLFYTEPISFPGGSTGPTTCVDLRTGEVLWSRKDVPSLSFGFIFDVHQMNQHGVYLPILATSNFARCFDGDTGEPLFNVTGVPTGSLVMGTGGEQLRYIIDNAGNSTHPDWRLGQWNSSLLWDGYGYSGSTSFRPSISGTVDGGISNRSSSICRYNWNVSIPWRNAMKTTPLVFGAFYNDMLLCANGSLGRLPGISAQGIQDGTPITYFAVNLNPSKGAVGSVLWWNTVSPPAGNKTIVPNAVDPVNRIFLEEYRETVEWVAYSMDTGQKLWGPTKPQTDMGALDYYGNQFSGHMLAEPAYGNFYVVGFAGILYCYDIKTGNIKWTYGNGGEGNSTNAGYYAPRGNYPTMMAAIGNGVIYLETTEHTVTTPIYKGARTRAVNATDGTEIWTLSSYTGGGRSMSAFGIADGFATWFNGYDNQIYVVGRGSSATTVEVSPKVSVFGDSVLMEGTVMDTASGTKQNQQVARFPEGVPAVSDDSMIEWMEYIYQQKPRPTDVKGVEVTLSVLDANNNYREIGKAITDSNGFYSLMWTPDIPGKYTVYASFAGSKAYWPSHDETAFGVSEAPAAAPLIEIPTPPPTETYVLGAALAIIIAVAVVGAVLAMMLRKRA
jgi:outer membrane protein assembly factor BamB